MNSEIISDSQRASLLQLELNEGEETYVYSLIMNILYV